MRPPCPETSAAKQRRSLHKRTRSTRRLFEQPTEVAHGVHPIRSIHTQPVKNGSKVVRDRPALSRRSSRPVQSSSMTYLSISIGRNP